MVDKTNSNNCSIGLRYAIITKNFVILAKTLVTENIFYHAETQSQRIKYYIFSS